MTSLNPFALLNPPVALAHSVVAGLATGLSPVLGGSAVAVSLILVTLIVRTLLVPLSVRVVRADRARRALAPELTDLRRRHGKDPARLLKETRTLHEQAGVGQFEGLLPALAQAPVLMVVYRLCTTPVIAGNPNIVLASNLFGTPLARHGAAAMVVPVAVSLYLLTSTAWATAERVVLMRAG